MTPHMKMFSSEYSPFWALAIIGWLYSAQKKYSNLEEAYEALGFVLRDKNFPLAGWHRSLITDIYQEHINNLNREDVLRPEDV